MRYIIPAFFVCHYDTKEEAEQAAGKICCDVNQLLRIAADNDDHILLDEERPTIEVPGAEIDCELPHTANPGEMWACTIVCDDNAETLIRYSEAEAWEVAWGFCQQFWKSEGLGDPPNPKDPQEMLEAVDKYLDHIGRSFSGEDIHVRKVKTP